jgi:prevent-host-death family protein
MAPVTIQEAQAKLPELIHQLVPGEEVVISENNQPVAKLVAPRQINHGPFPVVVGEC